MRRPTLPPTLKPWLPLLAGASVVALLAGVAIGRIVDPTPAPSPQSTSDSVEPDGHVHGGGEGDRETDSSDVGGVSLSDAGYTLATSQTSGGKSQREWTFTIQGPDGEAVTEFAKRHGKSMHLFTIRRDLSGYQHRHPTMDPETGEWSIDLEFGEAGPWRVICDFSVKTADGSTPVTLGTDVTIDGDYASRPLPAPDEHAAADGLDVGIDFTPRTGVASPVLLSITKDGDAVEPQSYLGARGHLVAFRRGDVGFVHLHPDSERVDGALRFWMTPPSAGSYRLFLDVKVDKEVHTAAFTVDID